MDHKEINICCLFNYAPHYRDSIFQLMDQELKCDFYFGDTVFMPLEKLDYAKLKGYRSELRTKKIFRGFTWYFGIRKVFKRRYQIYLIAGDPTNLSSWILLLYCIILRKKIFMWCHGLKRVPTRKGRLLFKLFLGNATGGLYLYSNFSRNLMIKDGYHAEKLHVIYNSLNYQEQSKIRATLQESDIYHKYFRNADPVLLFIGRLTETKRLDLLLEAQKRLNDQHYNVNVVIIGSGNTEQELKKRSSEYHLEERTWFYGPSYEENQIATMIYNAAITVSPGSVGLTAIHSQMYGTPVITHDNFREQMPEFESIIPGKTGYFYKEYDVNDLVTKIKEGINQIHNDRDSIRKACYERIDKHYNPDFQIRLFKSTLYEDIVDHK